MSRPSIEESSFPLVSRLSDGCYDLRPNTASKADIAYRTATRALKGLQKEAIIAASSSGNTWRMVCDEGPFLNGTDLAPPPLAFFSAGMAACNLAEIISAAKRENVVLGDIEITQDNFYSMEGSALRGTMTGGALPVEFSARTTADVSDGAMKKVVTEAIAKSPAEALMQQELVNTFSITCNGANLDMNDVAQSAAPVPVAPHSIFEDAQAGDPFTPTDGIIEKQSQTESVFDPDHGVGAALKNEQKRTLHIRAIARIRPDGLGEITVQIFKPIGSVFRFLSDVSSEAVGGERAPDGLAYLSAGIAFCYMTQLGRYTQIAKRELESYSIVQDTGFDTENCRALPVDTHVFLITTENETSVKQIVAMGEQTCFLHAACRIPNETKISTGSQ